MSDLPPPLVPPDVDLRDFSYMPLDVVRLRDSEVAGTATGDEFRAAVMLWCVAWHQIPAASLPDDDNMLARYAGFGRVIKEWKKVREGALHGFVKCSDGRLYHPVIAEKALDSWAKRSKETKARAADRERKRNKAPLDVSAETAKIPPTPSAVNSQSSVGIPAENALKGEQGRDKGNKGSDANASGAGAPPDTPGDRVKELWDRGLRVLGPSSRALLGKMRKAHGDPAVAEAIIVCEEEQPSDPVGFFVKTLAKRAATGGVNGSTDHAVNGSFFAGREQRAAAQRERAVGEIARATGLAGNLEPSRGSPGFDPGNSPIIEGISTHLDTGDAGADGGSPRTRGGPAWQT